jgi:hypothetical protein
MQCSFKYLAIYEIDADHASVALAEPASRAGTQLMPMTDAIAPKSFSFMFSPITEHIEAPATQASEQGQSAGRTE